MKRKPRAKLQLKKRIRIRLKKLRSALKPLILSYKSSIIMKKLFKMEEFKQAKSVLFYVSFNNEVDTYRMIKKAIKLKKAVYVPITDFKNQHLTISRIRVFPGHLEKSVYGIMEPKSRFREIFRGKKMDMIIVPGVGFDHSGNRLGYGGGFYDRLLKRMKALKIGLAFDFQVLKFIPTDNNDQKLDLIITDKDKYVSCS